MKLPVLPEHEDINLDEPDARNRTALTEAKARGSIVAATTGRLLARKDVSLILDITAVEHHSCGLRREGTRVR